MSEGGGAHRRVRREPAGRGVIRVMWYLAVVSVLVGFCMPALLFTTLPIGLVVAFGLAFSRRREERIHGWAAVCVFVLVGAFFVWLVS